MASYSFSGKRVLVTGGGRGIGYEIVKKFYNDGAVVFVIDKEASLLAKVKSDFPTVTTICVDLLNWNAAYDAVKALAPLDHLVNNAGVLVDETLLDVKPESFDLMYGVNVKAAIVVSQAFVKGIIESKTSGGTIVNLSSLADRVAAWGLAVYGTSKAAVTQLTRSMALEYSEYNIKVNCVSPSFTGTEMVAAIKPQFMEKAVGVMSRSLVKEPLLPEDIANTVLLLSSPLTRHTTGTSVLIDSGVYAN